jgi:hypothetical protein
MFALTGEKSAGSEPLISHDIEEHRHNEIYAVTIQPGSISDDDKYKETNHWSEYDSNYHHVVDAEARNLFSIPGFKVTSQVYGFVSFFSVVISVASFFASYVTSQQTTDDKQPIPMLLAVIYFIIVAWFSVPIWQNFSLKNKNDETIQCETNGCIYFNCLGYE